MAEEIDIQQIIKDNLTRIRGIVRDCSTKSVVWCAIHQHRLGFPHPELSSPAKQLNLLLGLMLETKETNEPIDFTPEDWLKIVEPLEMLSRVYALKYLDTDGEHTSMPEPLREQTLAAMTTFFDYHETGLLASVEQVIDRIKEYIAPFDYELSSDLGLSASEAVQIAQHISTVLQQQLDLIHEHEPDRSASNKSEFELAQSVDDFGKISLTGLAQRFGDRAHVFWKAFSVARGQGPQISYPTEPSIVEKRPLIRISEDVAMLFNANILYTAILLMGERTLAKGPIREKFLKGRDNALEDQVAYELSRMLGHGAKVYRNLFETPDNQYEHDLILLTKSICLFVEIKASPPDEPFRNPEKAFVRLYRKFHSDRGIQKSYCQSLRLYEALGKGDLELFDKNGNQVLRLTSSIQSQAFCVCVTRDSYGPLATNLSFMLEKSDTHPYPWAVNILDLGQIADLWQCFQWDDRHLRNFLSQRIALQGRVFSEDELNFVAAYFKHCGLHHFTGANDDKLQLTSIYESFLNAVYYHVHHRHPRPVIDPVYPTGRYIRKSLLLGKPLNIGNLPIGSIQVGRNEACPCGSGVKFKRCHGQ